MVADISPSFFPTPRLSLRQHGGSIGAGESAAWWERMRASVRFIAPTGRGGSHESLCCVCVWADVFTLPSGIINFISQCTKQSLMHSTIRIVIWHIHDSLFVHYTGGWSQEEFPIINTLWLVHNVRGISGYPAAMATYSGAKFQSVGTTLLHYTLAWAHFLKHRFQCLESYISLNRILICYLQVSVYYRTSLIFPV